MDIVAIVVGSIENEQVVLVRQQFIVASAKIHPKKRWFCNECFCFVVGFFFISQLESREIVIVVILVRFVLNFPTLCIQMFSGVFR